MAFITNYSENRNFEIIPAGKYEVVIKDVSEETSHSGTGYLNAVFVIRNDVEQKFCNRYLFYRIWKKKEPTQADLQVQGYSFKQLMNLAESAKLPSGKSYETVADLCKDFKGRAVLATVEHEEYNGTVREKVKFVNVSKHPVCRHVFTKNSVNSDEFSADSGADFVKDNNNSLDGFEEILGDCDVPF